MASLLSAVFERVGAPRGLLARRLRPFSSYRGAAVVAFAALTALVAVGAGAAVPAAVAGAGPASQSAGSMAAQAAVLQADVLATGQRIHQLAVATEAAAARLSADSAALHATQTQLVGLRVDLARATDVSRTIALETYMGEGGAPASALAGLFDRSSTEAAAGQAYANLASTTVASAVDTLRRDRVLVARHAAALSAQRAAADAAYRALTVQYATLQRAGSSEQSMLDQVRQEQLVLAVQQVAATAAAGPPAAVPFGALVGASGSMAQDLARLRQCESGDNYQDDTGNGYYGAYQFSLATWHGLGYPGLPSQAPPATQDQAAIRLQHQHGWGQWPACSAMLGLT